MQRTLNIYAYEYLEIKNNFIELFKEVPKEIEKIYVPPNYQLYERYEHLQSIKTIELIFEELEKM